MEVVRKILNASQLLSVIPLPEAFKNRKLEVIVIPAEEPVEKMKDKKEIEEAVDFLAGSIPDEGMDLEDYRNERLKKYEVAN